jgi:hypothetical protein
MKELLDYLTLILCLNLWRNKIGYEGTIALCQSNFINLQDLNLSANQIGDEGAAVLPSANLNLKEIAGLLG